MEVCLIAWFFGGGAQNKSGKAAVKSETALPYAGYKRVTKFTLRGTLTHEGGCEKATNCL